MTVPCSPLDYVGSALPSTALLSRSWATRQRKQGTASSREYISISPTYLYGGIECLRTRYVVHDQCPKCALKVHLVGLYRRREMNGPRKTEHCALSYSKAAKHLQFRRLCALPWCRSFDLPSPISIRSNLENTRPNGHTWDASLE